MLGKTKTQYTTEQVLAWLRGLFSIAWVDGNFEAHEQELILSFMEELHSLIDLKKLQHNITPEELAVALGDDPEIRENFLRTAVMVAIADGIYGFCEDELLHNFATALEKDTQVLKALRSTLCVSSSSESNTTPQPTDTAPREAWMAAHPEPAERHWELLHPLSSVQDWLDGLQIHDARVAHFLCRMIPPQCPFERDIKLFGHKIVHIPPMCKLNPLYEQLVSLRFRALSFLADECHEDISRYC